MRACPTEALKYGDSKDIQHLLKKAEIFPPKNNKPKPKVKVFYIGLPSRFIAGEVYSPKEDKCIEGATVTAKDLTTNESFAAKTNNYGDFWLEKLNDSIYSLIVEKEGYYPKEINSISTMKDVNLGEIKLYKRL